MYLNSIISCQLLLRVLTPIIKNIINICFLIKLALFNLFDIPSTFNISLFYSYIKFISIWNNYGNGIINSGLLV